MNIQKDEIVVLDIAGALAIVVGGNVGIDYRLTQLGFTLRNDRLERPITDVADRKKLVNDLISLGALFSTGRDWSPAEVVDLYRQQGAVTAGYRQISWTRPDQYVIVDR